MTKREKTYRIVYYVPQPKRPEPKEVQLTNQRIIEPCSWQKGHIRTEGNNGVGSYVVPDTAKVFIEHRQANKDGTYPENGYEYIGTLGEVLKSKNVA